jgi:hypothetical protein
MEKLFDPNKVKRWRRDVWRAFESEGFKPHEIIAAMVMFAVNCIGTDLLALSQLTGSSEVYCQKVLRRLRKNGVVSGQKVRVSWRDENNGWIGPMLDAGVAAGLFERSPDTKRSAAQKARDPKTRHRGPRKARTVIARGAVFSPQVVDSNPLYGLTKEAQAEFDSEKCR